MQPDRLVFLIGPPRSGSTLLARMLGAHSAIHAPDEPHLLTPLAHLGYYATVERAPYDPVITRQAMRALVGALPHGEADYLDALRACADRLYAGLLEGSGARLLLDKTPAYALVLDFVARLYPGARYIVLTRNPLAVWSSYVQSFFDGDHRVAHSWNPLLERYVPAVGRFLRERPVPQIHVRYEELVADPEAELRRLCQHLELPFEPAMVEYGSAAGGASQAAAGLGDPTTVAREGRPTTGSVDRWARVMAGDPARVIQAREILARLTDEDLRTWGYERKDLEADLDAVEPRARPSRRRMTRYLLQRKLLVALRRNIHRNLLGRALRRVREVCDVLLR